MVTAGVRQARAVRIGELVRNAVAFACVIPFFGFAFAACGDPAGGGSRLTGAVSIEGVPRVWQTLEADTSGFGTYQGGFSFLWIRVEGGTTHGIGRGRSYTVIPEDIGHQIAVIAVHRDYLNAIRSGQLKVGPSISYNGYFPIYRGDFAGRRVDLPISNFLQHEGAMPLGIRLVSPYQYDNIQWFRDGVFLTDATSVPLDAVFLGDLIRNITVVVYVDGVPSSVMVRVVL